MIYKNENSYRNYYINSLSKDFHNHYIVFSYQKVKATNISSNLSKGNSLYVVNSVLQEIKDGKVIWQLENIFNPKYGNLICSFRNLDEVIKLDRKT
ncbi:TPA: hypothetical protein ACKOR7_002773 [Clostridioides difficile]